MDVSSIRDLFLNLIPEGDHILDLGCGSGRDSRFFLDHGYTVTAVDASDELANLASEFIGKPVEKLSFQELDYSEAFNGIWACASLLHCPKSEMGGVMQRMIKALKTNGIIYMSFKHGTDERIDERGRFFNDYTETEMSKLLAGYADLHIAEISTESKPLRISRVAACVQAPSLHGWVDFLRKSTDGHKGCSRQSNRQLPAYFYHRQ